MGGRCGSTHRSEVVPRVIPCDSGSSSRHGLSTQDYSHVRLGVETNTDASPPRHPWRLPWHASRRGRLKVSPLVPRRRSVRSTGVGMAVAVAVALLVCTPPASRRCPVFVTAATPTAQVNALVALYNAAGGPFWASITTPWSGDPCSPAWTGVTCVSSNVT